ncbi:hypothetical protein [Formosa haliotis]|uniref:hypothetical protein n=1 Tax=Formosa haliotis TaxID=1555194 RepID=UPI0011463EA7|nr:hypothetical protein [Formosa haliotis]
MSNFNYTEPIYEFASEEKKTSGSGQNFIAITNQTLDSIFTVDNIKYKTNKKVVFRDKEKFSSTLIPKLNKIIEQIESQNSVEQIEIPKECYALKESQFLMLTLIRPTLQLYSEQYASSLVSGPLATSYVVESSDIYVFIIDYNKDEIAFYGKSSGKLNNRGFRNKIIKDINAIYNLRNK